VDEQQSQRSTAHTFSHDGAVSGRLGTPEEGRRGFRRERACWYGCGVEREDQRRAPEGITSTAGTTFASTVLSLRRRSR
jgi:hypothetical protein